MNGGGPDVDIPERKNGSDVCIEVNLPKEKNNNNNMPATTFVYGPMPYS